ncbi:MAG: radical SAM protein, partial [Candidatus Bathyarchaeota archaeon]
MSILRKVKKVIGKPKVPHGLYMYRGRDEYTGLALQLRVEPDGNGLLVINANTVLYLNRTATAHAYLFMQGMPIEKTLKKIKRMYRVNEEVARKDHERILYTISTLAQTEEVCPISFLDIQQIEPFTQELSAPIRMDLALTFRCQNNCVHCYTGGPRNTPEYTTDQWKEAIDRIHEIGIFLLTFTGGEPTMREDLPELLHYAQEKGIVTGLITNGRRLKDKEYVRKLEDSGLDFVQITLESHDASIHETITAIKGSWQETVEGIKNIIPTQIYITTNTTLNKLNAKSFIKTIEFLH